MQKQGQVGVYKLFKLGRGTGGLFTNDFKNLERDVHVVAHEYAEKVNRFSNINGLSYEYCEKETKLYWDKKPFKEEKEYTEFEDINNIEIKEYVNVSEIESLKAEYETLSGKKAHHLWKEDKLIEKIAELKK